MIITDPKIVRQLISTFESDWAETDSGKKGAEREVAKKKKKKRRKPVEGSEAGELPAHCLCPFALCPLRYFSTMSVRIGPRTASRSSFSFCGTPAESSAFTRSSTSASKSAFDEAHARVRRLHVLSRVGARAAGSLADLVDELLLELAHGGRVLRDAREELVDPGIGRHVRHKPVHDTGNCSRAAKSVVE